MLEGGVSLLYGNPEVEDAVDRKVTFWFQEMAVMGNLEEMLVRW